MAKDAAVPNPENKVEDILEHQRLQYVGWLDPLKVPHTATLEETIKAMRDTHIGYVMVCEDETLVGVYTVRHYLYNVAGKDVPGDTPITEVMTHKPLTLTPNHSMGDLIRTIVKEGYRHVPIVDKDDRILGIMSPLTVAQYIADHFPSEVLNIPAEPRKPMSSAEGA